jgi:hypothetical protein
MAALATRPAAQKAPGAACDLDSDQACDQDLFTCRNLLQELLMALLGYTGDVFVDATDGDAAQPALQHPAVCTVRLAPDLDWVEPRDRALLDRLAALGFHFKQLRLFVERERGAAPRSAYRQALCSGITGERADGAARGGVRPPPLVCAPTRSSRLQLRRRTGAPRSATTRAPTCNEPRRAEFLGLYQDAVLELQRQLLEQPAAGLATLQYQLLPMQVGGGGQRGHDRPPGCV